MTKNILWKFLNERFPSLVLTALIFVTIPLLTLIFMFKSGSDKNAIMAMEARDDVVVTDFRESVAPPRQYHKFVGTIQNNSAMILASVYVTVSYYDDKNCLIDVIYEQATGVSDLKPGDTQDFFVERIFRGRDEVYPDMTDLRKKTKEFKAKVTRVEIRK